jgi:type III pantothenate kinase
MIIVADAGNTNIKLAVFKGEYLKMVTRMSAKARKSPEAYRHEILSILCEHGVHPGDIEGVAVSTVVPEATESFLEGARQLFLTEPLVVGSETKTGITIQTEHPAELGADRLVNAAAAFHIYGGPVLVIDFGTATTYDVMTRGGEFLGGIIAPGMEICAEALWAKTARLPKISIERPPRIMGTNTVSSMQSGIYYGYLGQVEYMIRRLKEEFETNFKVIATGGLSGMFNGATDVIDIFEPELTLKGLNYIARINRKSS